jgi:hypothetical protein
VYAAPDNAGITAIHSKVDDVTSGFDALYTMIDGHTTRFTSLDNQVDHVHSGLNTVTLTVDNIHDTDLPALKTVADAAAADALAAHTKVDLLHDFDPAADVVARVTLVDTTTTNTDALDWLYQPPA